MRSRPVPVPAEVLRLLTVDPTRAAGDRLRNPGQLRRSPATIEPAEAL